MKFLEYLLSSLVLAFLACAIVLLAVNVLEFFTTERYVLPDLAGLNTLGTLCLGASILRALALTAEDYL